MEVIGWCKNCGEPIFGRDFLEETNEFDPFNNELIRTIFYVCPKCETEIHNIIVYELKEKEDNWEGLTKCDPNYGI